MVKLLYISVSLGVFVSLSAFAVEPSEHYRTLHVQAEFTKESKDFQVKNLFPFYFPKDLPGTPVLKGVKGQFSTRTQAKLDKNGQDITVSETLFGADYATNRCPKAGEPASSYQDYYGKYRRHGLFGNIVKQTKGDTTQVSDIDMTFKFGKVIDVGTKGCGIIIFDGTDFNNKPYTMKVDLDLKYTFEPITTSLGGEFIVGADNQKHPALNAYVVLPVKKGPGKGYNVLRPGTIYSVGGNIASAATYSKTKGHWFIRYITAVYKKNSCQIAFKNHSGEKFFWNDKTGTENKPNPSSVFWPDVTIISDFTVAGKDRESIMKQVNPNHKLPIHIEDGDCVVQAALPYGDSTTVAGSHMNTEFQVAVQSIPD